MLLTIDVGNTQTVLGLFEGEEIVEHWRVSTDPQRTADEHAVLYQGLMGNHPLVGAGGVDGHRAVLHGAVRAARDARHDPPLLRRRPVSGGRARRQDRHAGPGGQPEGGRHRPDHQRARGGPPLRRARASWWTSAPRRSFDAVSARGEYIGGAIAPGIEISVDALGARGAQLRKIELARPRSVIGKNTVECMQAGILYGFAGQVDGVVNRMADELADDPNDVTVVATGGLAPLILDEAEVIDAHEPWLTLIGLRLVYERNIGTT